MKIRMQEGENSTDLTSGTWDIGIIGRQIDDRGKAAVDFITKNTGRVVFIEYDSEKFTLTVDNGHINAEELDTYLQGLAGKTIILESTTLGFVEIFLCCKALNDLGFPGASFLYVEPGSYTLRVRKSSTRRSLILHKRDFGLSDEVPGYRAIPGATLLLSDRFPQRSVFFLGYEERRLDRALEDNQLLKPEKCSVVFGVPAFKPGWEMDAFANNIRVINERKLSGDVYYCGAENPASAVEVLETIYGELAGRERLFISPIGTKPNGVGVALFAATHPTVGLLYDHPKRRRDRSENVSRWHLYNVDF
jgi:hypothetical protein